MELPPMPTAEVLTQRKNQERRLREAASGGPEVFMPQAEQPQTLTVPTSMLSAVANNADPNIVAQLCGFDPFDLLNTVDFPNDRFERLLRISKEARQLALRHEEIPLSDFAEDEPSLLNGSFNPSVVQFSHGSNLLTTVLEPTTKFSLDKNEGIKVEVVANQNTSEAVQEAKLKEKEVLKEQLARSAAAIMIQSFMRGFLVRRKFIAVVYAKLTMDSHDTDTFKGLTGLPSVFDLSIQEKVIRKFRHYVKIFEQQNNYLPDYPHFAAAKIQATFRMCVFRKKWKAIQAMSAEEKAGNLGRELKAAIIRKAERADYKTSTYVKAARKIYYFYKNLIQFREAGNPCFLLKYVNPKESKLIDSACGIHVRFRLGGTTFPPTIYYKIFIHHKLVDMNAFSPRDYTKTKQLLPRQLFTKGYDIEDHNNTGWYQRIENNGWRPIVERNWKDELLDDTTTRTAAKKVKFHHLKFKRREELEKMKKLRKLEWMRKLYDEGKKLSTPEDEYPEFTPTFADYINKTNKNQEKPKPHVVFQTEEQLLQAMAELETELEHDFLMKWSEALDFDAYSQDWLVLATTGKSDEPNAFAAALMDTPLKGFINPTVDALNHTFNEVKKKTSVYGGPASIHGTEAGDQMMAEIDLFRKIAAESGITGVDGRSVSDDDKKMRPWSGRSNKSLKDMFLGAKVDEF
ncbi:hypothetical protein HDU99_007655 [Rhizoclosmatium hyalinum]|nr:hypothetical protein HDU99_007655 [Rhizoclosmatium hyalinum]